MEKFLQLIGWLGVAAVAFILNAGRGPNAILAFASTDINSAVDCGIHGPYGLRGMLAKLKAIQAATERQADIFQKRWTISQGYN